MQPEISPLTEAHKHLLRRYGNHIRTCAWQMWFDSGHNFDDPGNAIHDCDCGWLEVLTEACKPAGTDAREFALPSDEVVEPGDWDSYTIPNEEEERHASD